jgi:hypothetical protein
MCKLYISDVEERISDQVLPIGQALQCIEKGGESLQ